MLIIHLFYKKKFSEFEIIWFFSLKTILKFLVFLTLFLLLRDKVDIVPGVDYDEMWLFADEIQKFFV
tara:strand:- start:18 stop:218 length:201 start_codon:yes stop_codon:yes gene_type:complete